MGSQACLHCAVDPGSVGSISSSLNDEEGGGREGREGEREVAVAGSMYIAKPSHHAPGLRGREDGRGEAGSMGKGFPLEFLSGL